MKKSLQYLKISLSVIACSFGFSAVAQNYNLDSTFNSNGIKVFNFTNNIDRAFSCVLQPDQKLIAVGLSRNFSTNYFELSFVRLNVDGSVDATFGTNGFSYVSMGVQQSIGGQTPFLKLDKDGKIVAVNSGNGGSSLDMLICRLDTNGVLDTSFNTTGTIFIDMTGTNTQPDLATAFDFDSTGNIYVIGSTRAGGSPLDNNFAVVKVTSAGQLDTSFNSTGKKLFNPLSGSEFGRGIAVQADGKIVFGGNAGGNFYITRMDSTGVVDPTFNTAGTATIGFAGFADMYALDIDNQGRIVASGSFSSATEDAAICRLLPTGFPDNSFGTNGKASFNFINGDDFIRTMIILNDDKILLGGSITNTATGQNFLIARIDTNGTKDLTFNTTGFYTKSIATTNVDDEGNGMAIMDDGRIVMCGTTVISSAVNEDLVFMRIKPLPVNTAINEVNGNLFLNVYPNPCTDNITVTCNKQSAAMVSDLEGRLITTLTLNQGSNSINMGGYDKGIYILKTNSGQVVRIVKI
jgi:uncharacterized delta-60 repeat protein